MKKVSDVRKLFIPDFKSETRIIEGVEIGDVKGRCIQDMPQTPPDRSQIKITTPKSKEE